MMAKTHCISYGDVEEGLTLCGHDVSTSKVTSPAKFRSLPLDQTCQTCWRILLSKCLRSRQHQIELNGHEAAWLVKMLEAFLADMETRSEIGELLNGLFTKITGHNYEPWVENAGCSRQPQPIYSRLVIFNREGVSEVTGFEPGNEREAEKFFDLASAQWSDSFLCLVLRGPKV